MLKRRKKEAPAPGKLRQHQRRQPVVNNAHRPAAAASGTPPAPASRADATAQERTGPKQSAPGRCCGSRPKRRPTQPNAVRPPAVTVSVCDCSRGAGGEPLLVRLALEDLKLANLRRRLATAVRITDDTRLQCLAGDQWLTVLSGQDQLLLDVVSENADNTLTLRLQEELSQQDLDTSVESQPEPPQNATQRVRRASGGDSVAGSEPHRMIVDRAVAPDREVYAASNSTARPEQLSSHTVATDCVDATRSSNVGFPVEPESHSPEWLTADSVKVSPAASGISWSPRLEQTFDTARHINSQVEGKESVSAVDTSALHAVRELSARLGHVEAALQHARSQPGSSPARSLPQPRRPISPQFPRDDDSNRDKASQRLADLNLRAAQVQDELRRARSQRWSTSNSFLPQAERSPAVASPQYPSGDVSYRDEQAMQRLADLRAKAVQVNDELRRSREARFAVGGDGVESGERCGHQHESDALQHSPSSSSSLPGADRRSSYSIPPQLSYGEDTYRDEHASQRLADLGLRAAQVQDELRRAREARFAAFGAHGRGSEVAHPGHNGAAAAFVPPSVPIVGRRDSAIGRSHTPVATDPHDIARAQLANLREGFSQLLREETAKRTASEPRSSAPGRALKRPQIFDPKSPRGASFGATRQARFPHDARSSAEHRSIRRGSPTYDWTFE